MAAVTILKRAAAKAHLASVAEGVDSVVISDIERTSAGATALWTDAFTTGITIGSAGINLQIDTDAIIGPSDGTGIVIGQAGSGASTGSAPQMVSMTTTERDQLVVANGMILYNTTAGQIQGRTAAAWVDLGASAVGSDVGIGTILVSGSTATSFATITLALASAVSGDVVYVGPGTYAESFTIPVDVSVIGLGGRKRIAITGTLATGTRITLSNGSYIGGVSVTLPTDALPAIASAVTTTATAANVDLTGAGASGLGLRHTGSGTLRASGVTYLSGTCAAICAVTAGSLVADRLIIADGTITDGVLVSGGTFTSYGQFDVLTAATIVDIVEVGAGSVIVHTGHWHTGTNGLHVTNNSASVEMISVLAEGGVNTHLFVDAGITTASVTLVSGVWESSRFNIPIAWMASGLHGFSFGSLTAADEATLKIYSEFHVGSADAPHESVLGGGDSYTTDMEVHQFDSSAASGSKFTSVTAAARSATGSTFAYPAGAAIDDALYWAAPRKFPGIRFTQTTLMVPAASTVIVWEYYNGASWVAFNVCSSKRDAPRLATANNVFDTDLEAQVRFDDAFLASWVAADNVLDSIPNYGSNHFVVRARVTAQAPTTPPVFELSALYPDGRTEVNADGVVEFMGSSEPTETLSFVQAIDFRKGANNKPGSSNFAVSTNITLPGKDNLFQAALLNELFMNPAMPSAVDTSRKLDVTVEMAPTSTAAGNFEMQLDVSILNDSKTYDGLNTEVAHSSVVASPAIVGRIITFTFSVDISSAEPGADITFRLYRNAGVGSDTVVGDLSLLRADLAFTRYLV